MKVFNLGACRELKCRVSDREQRDDRRDGCIVRTAEGIGPSNRGSARRIYRAGCNAELGTARRRSNAKPALQQATRLVGARASRRRVSADVRRKSNASSQNSWRWCLCGGGGSNLWSGRAVDRVSRKARLVAKLGCLFRVGAKSKKTVRVKAR